MQSHHTIQFSTRQHRHLLHPQHYHQPPLTIIPQPTTFLNHLFHSFFLFFLLLLSSYVVGSDLIADSENYFFCFCLYVLFVTNSSLCYIKINVRFFCLSTFLVSFPFSLPLPLYDFLFLLSFLFFSFRLRKGNKSICPSWQAIALWVLDLSPSYTTLILCIPYDAFLSSIPAILYLHLYACTTTTTTTYH